MQDIISANSLGVRIGKQWKRIPERLRLAAANVRRIDADADYANTLRVEFRKPLLETPQLGVAEWSPKSTIENQHGSFRAGKQIAESDRFSILIE